MTRSRPPHSYEPARVGRKVPKSAHESAKPSPTGSRKEYIPSPPSIRLTVTPRAKDALIEVLRVRPRGCVIHLTMVAGKIPHPYLIFAPATRGEEVFEQDGLPFVVDRESRPHLADAILDHVVEDGFASFEVDGPNLPHRGGGTAGKK